MQIECQSDRGCPHDRPSSLPTRLRFRRARPPAPSAVPGVGSEFPLLAAAPPAFEPGVPQSDPTFSVPPSSPLAPLFIPLPLTPLPFTASPPTAGGPPGRGLGRCHGQLALVFYLPRQPLTHRDGVPAASGMPPASCSWLLEPGCGRLYSRNPSTSRLCPCSTAAGSKTDGAALERQHNDGGVGDASALPPPFSYPVLSLTRVNTLT